MQALTDNPSDQPSTSLPAPIGAAQSWWSDARCNDNAATLSGLFFSEELLDIARAKAICSKCPVQAECLAEALENQIEWGVWGGMTERERRALLRRRPNASWRSVLEAARTDHETVPASF